MDKMKVKNSWTVDECAQQCKGVSSLFLLGTDDYAENENDNPLVLIIAVNMYKGHTEKM